MTTPKTKPPKRYPFFGLRPSPETDARVRRLSALMTTQTGRRVGISEIVLTCLAARLPELERKHGIGGAK